MFGSRTKELYRFVAQVLCGLLIYQVSGSARLYASVPKQDDLVSAEELAALAAGREPEPDVVERVGERLAELRDDIGAKLERLLALFERGAVPPVQVASISEPPVSLLTDEVVGNPEAKRRAEALGLSPSPPPLPGQRSPRPSALGEVALPKAVSPDVPLLPGFNLVSLPNEPPDPSPAAVLTPIAGQHGQVFAYDACDAADPWKVYDPTDPASSDLTALDHTQGLWIDATAATVLPVEGTQPAVTDIPLCTGWNLVGYPLEQPRPVLAALSSIHDQLVRVFGFELADPLDPWEVWSAGVPAWANDLDLMQPGRGYWVLVTEDVTLSYRNEGPPPVIEIVTPADLAELTAPAQVVGTVRSDLLDTWTLSYRPSGEDAAFVPLASAHVPVESAALGEFDTTLLQNGLYDLKLEATDFAGQVVETVVSVAVDGAMKIGHFTLSFTDLSIALSGLDLEVIRNYDSRDKRRGDFGVGWTLDVRQGSYRNNRTPGDGWQVVGGTLPCQSVQETKSHLTTIRLSDREVYRFRLRLSSPAPVLGGCFAVASFQYVDGPLPGSTLQILGNTDVIYQNASNEVIDADSFEIYEPQDVRLRTRDGRVFDLDLTAGVERIEDLNGNTLQITPTGITHSSGTSIDFTRDGAGRIIRIVDPLGNTVDYDYDAVGDLVAVTDPEVHVTTFDYDGDHGLLSIVDPLGRQGVRNEYDETGRLVRTTDAFGNAIALSHDLDGRREVVTDRLGNVRVMTYDEQGNVTSETDALGNTTTRSFDPNGNVLAETDALGKTTTRTYTAQNDLASVTDALGNTTQLTYNSFGQLLTVLGPRGETITNSYDAAGNLLSTVDALGNTTSQTYDGRGNRLTQTDAEGGVTQFEFDAAGRMTRRIDPTGAETTFTYDAAGNPLSRTMTRTTPSGTTETLTTTATFDALGRRTSDTNPLGETASLVYDALGAVVESTDRLGRTTRQVLDAAGRLTSTVFPDGSSASQTYDAEGRLLTQTDRSGRVTRYTYDPFGRPTLIEHPDGSTAAQTYDALGRVTSMSDKRGNTVQFEYDALGRKTKITNALGQTMRFTYDAAGNRTSQTDGRGNTITFEYDLGNRLTRRVYPDGSEEVFTYDGMGRRLNETDQAGRTANFGYDARGRLVSVTDSLGQTTTYGYDELGARTSITDALGRVTRMEYDALGRLVRRTLPATGSPSVSVSETLEYDAAGNLSRHTRFDGAVTQFTYDSFDRLISKRYADGSEVSLTYTASGQRASMTDSRGTTTYTYDARDRLLSVTQPDGRALSYTYDVQGNRTTLSAFVGGSILTTTYTFDALNRLATVIDPDGRVYTHGYDANGNRASVGYPNGIGTSYTYDALNRLTSLASVGGGGNVVHSYDYTLDAVGNRTRIEEADGRTTDYTYDNLDRLTVESVADVTGLVVRNTFTYDAVGNRLEQARDFADGSTLTIPYTYDARDRVEGAGGVLYTWDDNGSLASRGGLDGAAYDWDFEDRLTRVTLADGTLVENVYDGDGNRVRTTVTPAGGSPQVVDYLVDTTGPLADVVAESDGSGALLALYVRGDDLLSVLRPGSGPRFYHADGLGSIRRLTDDSGNVTDTYTYSAFGELLDHTGSDPNPFLFAGEPRDPNSRFTYLRARYMDPELGRFVSRDHFPGFPNEPQSLHKYLYADDNPVNRVDPTGRFSVISLAAAIAIIGLLATGIFGVTAHHLALAKFPKDLDFFNPDAYIIGFSWSVAIGRLARWLRHPVGVGLAVGFAFAGLSASMEMLIPVNNPSQSWVYYSWGVIAGDIDRGKPAGIPTPYAGAAYNVPNPGAYTGASFCTSVNGRLAARKLGFPVNFCAGNSDPGTQPAASITLSRLSKNGRVVTGILKYGFIDVADFGALADAVHLPAAVDQLESWVQSLVVPP